MRKHWITLVALLAWLHCSYSQTPSNLVFNPSFEEHSLCPQRIEAIGIMRGVDAWWQPTRGSSDYFHPCGGRECQTPRNKMGYQTAHTGEAYCGIYCSKEHYREYLQTELKEPLVAGRRYRVGFWVSLSDKSPYAIVSMGALLTAERIADTSWDVLMEREITQLEEGQHQIIATYYQPQVLNTDSLLADSKEWQEVAGVFVAKGGEKYLTIGNFLSFNHSGVHDIDNGNAILQGAYYYIDDVSLVCIDCDSVMQEQPILSKDTLKRGDIREIEGVYFNTDKSDILPQSYNALQKLIVLLEEDPKLKIELRGHTDNQGTTEHNLRLSEARAKAVADYLIDRGISQQRLTWVGFGKSKPVDTNDTPEGRQHNRRVEYRITDR